MADNSAMVQPGNPSVQLIGPPDCRFTAVLFDFKATFLTDSVNVYRSLSKFHKPSLRNLLTFITVLIESFHDCDIELWFWHKNPAPEIWITNRCGSVISFQSIAPEDWDPNLFKDHLVVVMKVHSTISVQLGVRNILLTLEETKLSESNLS